MDMSPEAEDLGRDLIFEAGDQGGRDHHNGNAERHRHYGNADDQPRKGLLAGSRNPPCNEIFGIHLAQK